MQRRRVPRSPGSLRTGLPPSPASSGPSAASTRLGTQCVFRFRIPRPPESPFRCRILSTWTVRALRMTEISSERITALALLPPCAVVRLLERITVTSFRDESHESSNRTIISLSLSLSFVSSTFRSWPESVGNERRENNARGPREQ